MEPEPAPNHARSRGWISSLRRTLDSLLRTHQRVEDVHRQNEALTRQLADLTKLVHYQAGQIQQIDLRIRDAVEAQVLRELDRRGVASLPVGEGEPR
jgi:hypothetical protein